MKSITFIFISLFSGALSGLILAGINLLVVEPFIDKAISIETSKAIASGKHIDINEQNSHRIWQKSGSLVAGSILGMAYSSLLGIVYAFIRRFLPFSSDRKKAIFLSLIIYSVMFLIPFLKYPGNPPAVGNPATIYLRENLFLGYLAVSTITTLSLGIVFYKFRQVKHISIIIPIVYAIIISSAFILFPPNPDKISIPMDLVNSFRIASASTQLVFWIVLGIIFGLLWNKFKPHESSKITIT
jgi:predicted cobalt transporter CbtA